jgi:hypothetical protein
MARYTVILCLVLLASASRAEDAEDSFLSSNDELAMEAPVGKQTAIAYIIKFLYD